MGIESETHDIGTLSRPDSRVLWLRVDGGWGLEFPGPWNSWIERMGLEDS
ncbi:MAG: hypothetical protein AB7G75_29940 [Candidatus Binatia bacterium]